MSVNAARSELLFLTPLTPAALVTGKFFSAIGQTCLVLAAGLPVLAVVLSTYGGVSPGELCAGYFILLSSGTAFAAAGFLATCLSRRTAISLALSYLFMVGLLPASAVGLFLPLMEDSAGLLILTGLHGLITLTLLVTLLRYCTSLLQRQKTHMLQREVELPREVALLQR